MVFEGLVFNLTLFFYCFIKQMKKILFIIIFLSVNLACGAHLYPEKYYQNQWCSKWQGKQEVRLIDNTRIDCETKTYVVEFDFAPKWAESVGQSLHYARMTGKKPAIVLIIENESDYKHYQRLIPLCKKYLITLWYVKSPGYNIDRKQSAQGNYQDIFNILIDYLNDVIRIVGSIS